MCGLDCGLCPRYYTEGKSRCPGCGGRRFLDKHPSCSFITCCVRERGLEACGECAEFPCLKFKTQDEYRRVELSSSYPPYWTVLSNLRFIRQAGMQAFIELQRERIQLLRIMIHEFDDGRSKSFFCRAVALLDAKVLKDSLRTARNAKVRDIKNKANALKGILEEAARNASIPLRTGATLGKRDDRP